MVFGLLLVSLLGFAALQSKSKPVLKISSGQPGGVYLPLAKSIAAVLEAGEDELSLEVIPSDGSLANAVALEQGKTEIALIQNDTSASDALRTLVPMDLGALHFLARDDAGIESFSHLEGEDCWGRASHEWQSPPRGGPFSPL